MLKTAKKNPKKKYMKIQSFNLISKQYPFAETHQSFFFFNETNITIRRFK